MVVELLCAFDETACRIDMSQGDTIRNMADTVTQDGAATLVTGGSMKLLRLTPAFLLATLTLALVRPGVANGEDNNRPPPREPPSEAFQACQGKAEGDACTVQLPDLTLDGKCVLSHDNRVFCRPTQMPPPPR